MPDDCIMTPAAPIPSAPPTATQATGDFQRVTRDDDESIESRLTPSENLVADLRAQIVTKDQDFRKISFISAQDDLRASLLQREMETASRKISQLTQDQKFQDFAMNQLKNQIEGLQANLKTKGETIDSLHARVQDLTASLATSERRRRRMAEQLEVQALDRIASEDAFMRSLSALVTANSTSNLREISMTFGSILEEDRRKTRAWLADDGRNSQWAVLESDNDR